MDQQVSWLEPEMQGYVAKLSDDSILGLTLWGEARSEPVEGIVAVGCVIRNRATDPRWPDTLRDVCLQKKQFSCWRPEGGEKNYARMLEFAGKLARKEPVVLATLEQCAWVALGISRKALVDNTKGSFHYHVATMQPRPVWARSRIPVAQRAAHVFYSDIP